MTDEDFGPVGGKAPQVLSEEHGVEQTDSGDVMLTENEITHFKENMPDASEFEAEYVDLLQLHVGGLDFLLLAVDVAEIFRPIPLTPVPMAPVHLLGMGNLHGQIVCVIDPTNQLSLPELPKPDGESTRYVLLRHKRMRVALRVDAVTAIHRVNEKELDCMQEVADPVMRGRLNINKQTFDVLNAGELLQE